MCKLYAGFRPFHSFDLVEQHREMLFSLALCLSFVAILLDSARQEDNLLFF